MRSTIPAVPCGVHWFFLDGGQDGDAERRVGRNHALVDGNKRLTLAAAIAFYGLNGRRLTLTNDQAYDLVISIATGDLDTADAIAAILRDATKPRR